MGSKITVRGIVFSALFAALVAVFSFLQINLGFTPVPITLENMAMMMAGAFLGAGYGFFSMFLLVVLVTLGLPILNGSGGLALMFGPTGGYVWLYPICALLIGFFVRRIKGNGFGAFLLIFIVVEVFGSLLDYLTGVPQLMHFLHSQGKMISFQEAMIAGCYPYLPGDAIKAVLTALIVLPIRRIYPPERLVGTGSSRVAMYE